MLKKRCRSIAPPLQIQAVNCIMANLAEGVPQHLPPIAPAACHRTHSTTLKHRCAIILRLFSTVLSTAGGLAMASIASVDSIPTYKTSTAQPIIAQYYSIRCTFCRA